jgi:hypothetical protein
MSAPYLYSNYQLCITFVTKFNFKKTIYVKKVSLISDFFSGGVSCNKLTLPVKHTLTLSHTHTRLVVQRLWDTTPQRPDGLDYQSEQLRDEGHVGGGAAGWQRAGLSDSLCQCACANADRFV